MSSTTDTLRTQASDYDRQLSRRNTREAIAAVFVTGAGVVYTLFLGGILFKIAAVLLVVGALFVAAVYMFGGRATKRGELEGEEFLAAYRREMRHQVRFAQMAPLLCIAPLLPGALGILVSVLLDRASQGMPATTIVVIAGGVLLCLASFGVRAFVSSARLQRQLDALPQA